MDDSSLMYFGEHQGTPLEDVPATYLLWFDTQGWSNNFKHKALKEYIQQNMDELDEEAKNS